MRKLFSLSVVLMVVAGLLMSACTPAAAPAKPATSVPPTRLNRPNPPKHSRLVW